MANERLRHRSREPSVRLHPSARPVALLAAGLLIGAAGGASAHTVGSCPPVSDSLDRCELWSATYNDAAITSPHRSDQFPATVVADSRLVFSVVKDVDFDPGSPYTSTSAWVVMAYDQATGAV